MPNDTLLQLEGIRIGFFSDGRVEATGSIKDTQEIARIAIRRVSGLDGQPIPGEFVLVDMDDDESTQYVRLDDEAEIWEEAAKDAVVSLVKMLLGVFRDNGGAL